MTLKLILLILACTAPYFSQGQSPCNTINELRLNSTSSFTSTNNAGRLEICYCPSNGSNCTWATISAGNLTIPWSWKNVQVACRDLSINTGLGNPILQSTIRPADVALSSISIYPSTFFCDGTETKLSDCITLSIPTDSNVHSADVFINCLSTTPSRSLRLTGSTTRHQGVLEIYVSRIWQTFCPTNFDTVDANVVCQTLGYFSGTVRLFTKTGYKGTVISLTPTITGVSCGTVTNFDSCFYQTRGSCSSSNLIGVTCTPSSSTAGTIRLFSVSISSTYDRVEILYAGRWGTVCDNQWSITDGRVACRGLGYDVDDTDVPTSFTPPLSSQRPIWVSGYTCSGSESRLNTCTNAYPIGYAPSCSHSQDAGLSCSQGDGGGLSSGAIAGIVVGILVVLFIVVPLVYAYGNDLWKKGRIRGWWSRQRSRARAWTIEMGLRRNATTRENNLAALELELSNDTQETPQRRSSQRISSSDSSTTDPTTSVTHNEPDETNTLQNAELTKAPPPSYNEAIHLQHVQPPPPQYTSQEPEEKLPYPVSPYPSDPAYPPQPPPIGFDNQGYPPPTQYPPLDHDGMRLPGSTGSFNEEHDLPPSTGDLPYPD